jgi:hypothetical protein
LFIEPIQHLFLTEEVLIQFLVQVFRVFAPTDKVIGLGQFENVDVRHSLHVLLLILRHEVIRFAVKTDLAFHSAGESNLKMNNSAILAAYAAFKSSQHLQHIARLRRNYPKLADWSDADITSLYSDVVSCFQSKGGLFFEGHIEHLLAGVGVPFKAQVHLNSDGIIVESGGCTIPDIVFGNPVVGTHISNYAVLSLKTTSRERAKLDTAWTVKHPPKLFLYGTLDDDYPQPKTFGECETRKLICAKPKKRDMRQFKLGFEDLIDLVQG